MSRVPAKRYVGGYPFGMLPSSGVLGGSVGLRLTERSTGRRGGLVGNRYIDWIGSMPSRSVHESPASPAPAQVSKPTAPGRGNFCSGSHARVVCSKEHPPEVPNIPMFLGLYVFNRSAYAARTSRCVSTDGLRP